MTASMTAGVVSGLLLKQRLCASSEEELQRAVAALLLEAGIQAVREKRLGKRDRVDFLTADGLAIELKVDGRVVGIARQLQRYADSAEVKAILLVTTTHRHAPLDDMPSIGGKPLHVICLAAEAAL